MESVLLHYLAVDGAAVIWSPWQYCFKIYDHFVGHSDFHADPSLFTLVRSRKFAGSTPRFGWKNICEYAVTIYRKDPSIACAAGQVSKKCVASRISTKLKKKNIEAAHLDIKYDQARFYLMNALTNYEPPRGIERLRYFDPQKGKHVAVRPNAEKSMNLAKLFILAFTQPGDTVLDLCSATASTCVAAVLMDRIWFGVEKEELVWRLAMERLLKMFAMACSIKPFGEMRTLINSKLTIHDMGVSSRHRFVVARRVYVPPQLPDSGQHLDQNMSHWGLVRGPTTLGQHAGLGLFAKDTFRTRRHSLLLLGRFCGGK